ncbi:uncharacterized protein METZ01_LOCUS59145, partial [marine metagenome]
VAATWSQYFATIVVDALDEFTVVSRHYRTAPRGLNEHRIYITQPKVDDG